MQILTNDNQQELKSHGDFTFPVLVSCENIRNYEFETFSWHWHSEIELTLIIEGEMIYQINGNSYHLKSGNILFGNANTLHSGHSVQGQPCHYWSITFDPKIIYGFEDSLIQTHYVNFILNNSEFAALYFDGTRSWHRELRNLMEKIISLDREKQDFYELEIQMKLSAIWLLLLKHRTSFSSVQDTLNPKEVERLKNILGYIHDNYNKKISLDDIAGSVHICKSECCRFFKKHMKESLFDYLLRYRVERSIPYLKDANYNITEAALHSGFSDSGYYSRVFRKYTGCSPSAFRKKD